MVKLLHLSSNTDQVKSGGPVCSLMQFKFDYPIPGADAPYKRLVKLTGFCFSLSF